jgi:glycosyltransferase involved in cell wall biosynthesis
MENQPILSVVLPAYGEGDHIAASLRVIRDQAAATGADFELVVVDDGSPDSTWPELQRLAAELPELRAISLARNFGKEGAIRAGLEIARGEAVVLMDCDLQHPPELIPEMFRLWRQDGYHVVNAVKEDRGREGFVLRFCAQSFYRLFERLSGVELTNASDFKLLDRRVVDVLCDLPERNIFFRGIVPWIGYRQTALPFQVQERTGGTTKWSPLRRAYLAVNAIVSFSAVPLQFVTALGILFFLFSLVLAGQTLFVKLSGGAVEGFTTVILVLAVMGSILMVSLGIIGQYLAKIYQELKRRPRYLIKEQIRVNAMPRD